MSARLYRVMHPVPMWQVVFTDPEKRDAKGRAKKIRRHFLKQAEAEDYQKTLNKRLSLVGTTGLAMDATARADFWAGRQILDAAGHLKVTFRELAEKHVTRVPNAEKSPLLLELLPVFLAVKTDEEGAKAETVLNLQVRLKAWWRDAHLVTVADINRAAIEALRKRKGVGATTKKNDMNAASSFCSWLANLDPPLLPINPVLGIKRPKVVTGKPPIWQNNEVERLLIGSTKVARGKYLPAVVLMLANLRPSEVPHAKIIYTGAPCVKIEGDSGKMRGRANRVVPLWPAAVAWLKKAGKPSTCPALTDMSRQTICQQQDLKWKPDICRHTAISNRGAILDNDGKLAREAGTSETVIFRRYHRVRTLAEARDFYRIRPKKTNGR